MTAWIRRETLASGRRARVENGVRICTSTCYDVLELAVAPLMHNGHDTLRLEESIVVWGWSFPLKPCGMVCGGWNYVYRSSCRERHTNSTNNQSTKAEV